MTTTEQAADPLTIAIEQLADIVSGTAAFQESVAKYDKDGAREHIHKSFNRPPDGEITGPLAVIFELPGMRWDRRADGVALPFGELFLDLWTPMESEDGEHEERRFNN